MTLFALSAEAVRAIRDGAQALLVAMGAEPAEQPAARLPVRVTSGGCANGIPEELERVEGVTGGVN